MDDFKSHLSRHGKLITWGIVGILFSATLLLLSQFLGELKSYRFIGQGIEFQDIITVSGTGEVTAIPDTAEFSFAVVERAETVEGAQEAVTAAVNAILEYLKDFGVDEKDIKTTNYNIAPRYEYRRDESRSVQSPIYPPPGRQILIGYEVSHWITVKVRDTKDAGELLAQVGSRGATNVSSVSFTIDDEEKVKRDARKKAIKDAKEKAEMLADDLGVSLVKIVNFSESGGSPIYFARALAVEDAGIGGTAPPVPEIPAGENTIMSNVTVTWAIE